MTAAAADTSGVRVLPPVIYLAGLAIGFLLHWLYPVPVVPAVAALWTRVFGWMMIAIGFSLSVWAIATFRRAGTTPDPTRPTTALALGGPYVFTRNPMYLSLALVSAGIALVGNALWPLVLLVFVIFVIRREVIAREERYLESKFGKEYVAYKVRVRRWI